MYFDGWVMKTGAGAGPLFVSPLGEHMRYVVRLHLPTSNNMAEYEALLSGLRIAIELGVKCLDVRGDSQLVIDQVMKESSCHDAKMEVYCNAVRRLEDKFDGLELNHITRKYNEEADDLAKIASGQTTVPPNVFARNLTKRFVYFKSPAEATKAAPEPSGAATAEPLAKDPSVEESEAMDTETEISSADEAEAMETDEAPPSRDWHAQYLDWMIRGVLPSDRAV
jgi:ribonuclease HI